MTIYVLWQNCWEILWLIVHLELVILSSQQVGFLFTFSFKARFCSILVNNCVFICALTLWFPDTSVQHHYNLALISVTNDFFSGFSLLQKSKMSTVLSGEQVEAPPDLIQEAILFHPFAEAAYTVTFCILHLVPFPVFSVILLTYFSLQGPLLDFGRNPLMFPCVWLNRQGILTPWTRAR